MKINGVGRRAKRPKTAKLAANERLCQYVQDRLDGIITLPDGMPAAAPDAREWKAGGMGGAPTVGQCVEQRPIALAEPRLRSAQLALQHHDLVAQDEDLDIHPADESYGREDPAEKLVRAAALQRRHGDDVVRDDATRLSAAAECDERQPWAERGQRDEEQERARGQGGAGQRLQLAEPAAQWGGDARAQDRAEVTTEGSCGEFWLGVRGIDRSRRMERAGGTDSLGRTDNAGRAEPAPARASQPLRQLLLIRGLRWLPGSHP